MSRPEPSEFERAAAQQPSPGLLSEIWSFLKQTKKWWLLPLILVLLTFGVLILLAGTGLAPFIYTLF